MKIIELINAVENDNLAEVKQLVEIKDRLGLDINACHPVRQIRAIDVAAKCHHLSILDYLMKQGACIATQPTSKSLLYWLMRGSKNKKGELVYWLKTNQYDLLKADATLTLDHFNAALGLEANWESQALCGGLKPIHYGALVANPYCLNKLPALLDHPLPEEGCFNFLTLSWLLASFSQWSLLNKFSIKNHGLNLNVAPQRGRSKGVTIAWLMANSMQLPLLHKLACTVQTLNLQGAPQAKTHPSKGIPLAWLLANHQQWSLLNKFIDQHLELNLNVAIHTENHIYKGITIAWLLAFYKQWSLLEKFVKQGFVLDLIAAPQAVSHFAKGITLLELLINNNQWELIKLIINNYISLKGATNNDLEPLKMASSNPNFQALINYAQLKQQELVISGLLINYLALTDVERESEPNEAEMQPLTNALKEALALCVVCLGQLQLDKTNPYYQESQRIKFHIVEQFTHPKLPVLLLQDVINIFPKSQYLYNINDIDGQLLLLRMEAIINAGDSKLGVLLIAELLQKNTRLELALGLMNDTNQVVNAPLRVTASNNGFYCPARGTKRKSDEEEKPYKKMKREGNH